VVCERSATGVRPDVGTGCGDQAAPAARAQALGATVHATRNLTAGRLDLVEPHATAYCGVVRAASARAGIATTVREAAAR
jgi:hypothetical protein